MEVAWPPLVAAQPPLELAKAEWGGGVGVVATGGTGELGRGVIVGVGIQCVKMSRSFEMVVSCLWWMAAGASLIAQERKWRACTMRLPFLTVGLVRYLCRKSTVSEYRSALVAPLTTWKQR